MNTLFMFIIALICYAVLVAVVIYSITLFKRTKDLNPLLVTRDKLLSDLRAASSTLAELTEQNETLRDEAVSYQSIIEEGKKAKEFLEENGGTIEAAENKIARLKKDMEEANTDYSELVSKIDEENSRLSELREQSQNAELDLKHADYEKKMAEERLESIESSIASNRDELNKIKSDIASFENRKREYDDLLANIAAINQRIAEKEKEYKELVAKVDQKEREFNRMKDEYDNLSGKFSKLTDEYKENEKQLKELQSSISAATPLNERLQSENAYLKENIDDKKQQLEKLTSQEAELEEKITTAKENLSSIKDSLAFEEEHLSGIQAKIDNAIGGDNTWGDLDNPLIVNSAFTEPSNFGRRINELDELDKFSSELESCNIKFDRRTINAFHTSLKVADSSPLVVLAGISGTGKSLLPQLYAKHFGFNFLNMAVQPRWDSSQDLFGFYNYAQYRYKATELSRLLWQYDVYNNEKCKFKEKDAPLLPMNIVLLDEMNLARVEYYFSDMLSKLETRRTIDVNDAYQRQLAEIEIECGSTALPRRLFVGSNTLFVGTMNEDETTQALSDKVMDRANVLRFGRPKSLEAKADPVMFENRYASDIPIRMKDWKQMTVHKPSSFDSKLAKTIEELNSAMDRTGRPFAHRVKMAMTNYIKCYPGANESTADFNHALADQIEFKIMPKLNGVEKGLSKNEKALDSLGEIISGIDAELFAEFERARKDDFTFFQWHGVRR